jgi:hypothetical protein
MAMSTGIVLLTLVTAVSMLGQAFSSGSTGADGALELTIPGMVVFDPAAFKPALNPSGDSVYQFTFVHIGPGVTVKFSSKVLHGPVFWVVQGPVQIEGTIDLNGEDGDRLPSAAGAGGYPGGAVKGRGHGPSGAFKRNAFLVPLVGGDGGQGGETQGGGAGGGALLIASSAWITISGTITANGGSSEGGHGGNGGAIRLVAPLIDGSGLVTARGGQPDGVDGRVRIEASENNFSGTFNGTPLAQGKPLGLFLPPDPPPSARIVSIGGTAISKAEFTVRNPTAASVLIEAHNIPTGTILVLQCFSDEGSSQEPKTTPLEGTFQRSEAVTSVKFPTGSSHCYVEASWKQPLPYK